MKSENVVLVAIDEAPIPLVVRGLVGPVEMACGDCVPDAPLGLTERTHHVAVVLALGYRLVVEDDGPLADNKVASDPSAAAREGVLETRGQVLGVLFGCLGMVGWRVAKVLVGVQNHKAAGVVVARDPVAVLGWVPGVAQIDGQCRRNLSDDPDRVAVKPW